jgi:plastocyanin
MRLRIRSFFALPLLFFAFSPGARADKDTVQIRDFRFIPASLIIQRHDTVVWKVVQQCCLAHTVSRDAEPMSWDSGPLFLGATFQLAFPDTGAFGYFCSPHQGLGMLGSVTVVLPPPPPPSTIPTGGWLGLMLLAASLTAAGIWILEHRRKTV